MRPLDNEEIKRLYFEDRWALQAIADHYGVTRQSDTSPIKDDGRSKTPISDPIGMSLSSLHTKDEEDRLDIPVTDYERVILETIRLKNMKIALEKDERINAVEAEWRGENSSAT